MDKFVIRKRKETNCARMKSREHFVVYAKPQGITKCHYSLLRQLSSIKCFVEDGFSNWKKILEKFQAHEKSDFHRAAVSLTSWKEKQSVSQLISSGYVKQMEENRIALLKIFTTLRYLGRQGLPVREKVEEELNLIVLLKEWADDVAELHQ